MFLLIWRSSFRGSVNSDWQKKDHPSENLTCSQILEFFFTLPAKKMFHLCPDYPSKNKKNSSQMRSFDGGSSKQVFIKKKFGSGSGWGKANIRTGLFLDPATSLDLRQNGAAVLGRDFPVGLKISRVSLYLCKNK